MTTTRLIIGTDEAGYGPNLGPLVITATAWSVRDTLSVDDLWEALAAVISRERSTGDRRLHVADSKVVYSPSTGIEALERAVLAFHRLQYADHPLTVRDFGRLTSCAEFCDNYDRDPCRLSETTRLPVAACPMESDELTGELARVLDTAGITLVAVRSRILFPPEFNLLCRQTDSKGVVLSEATLQLVREVVDAVDNRGLTSVFCDKHGGRNRYDELIADLFDDAFVFRLQESRSCSRYRTGDLEFCFRTKAEELLPVALASMFAKYTREILMNEFNAFWNAQLPTLRPTKGYPVDAARFRDQIAATAATLGISEAGFWRTR